MFGPPTFFPPVPINEPGSTAPGPVQGVTLEVGIPVFVAQNPAPAFSTGKGAPLNLPTDYSPPLNFQQVGD